MNKNVLAALIGGLAVGFAAGYLVFGGEAAAPPAKTAAPAAPVMPAPSLAGTMPSMGQGPIPTGQPLPSPELQARIAQIEAAVLADPKNHDAWVALGNDYFDSHQAQKAVDAYARALALKPDDPNVLTDQGVMYRQLGKFDQALACFQKANKLHPEHVQSLFNMGVVYASDLNKPTEAAKAWNKVLTTAPNSDQAAQARQMLSQLPK